MLQMAAIEIASHEDRYRLLLEISRIVNAPLELAEVTDAIAQALKPLAALDCLVLLTVEEGKVQTRSIHIDGFPRQEGDTFADIAARAVNMTRVEVESRMPTVKPLAGTNLEHAARLGRPYVVNHLARGRTKFEMEGKLIDFGVKAYVLCPLIVRDNLIGALSVSRRVADSFTEEEVNLFGDVSGIVATALSNSLAYSQIQRLTDRLQAENVLLRQRIADVDEVDEMIGDSRAIRRVREAIDKVAPTDSTVLIFGETGTGKELVARAIHARSSRSKRNLVKVNCAALPEALIASELFGHERGAFTGAVQRRIGRFEMAAGSSLFMDEIGEVPPDVQVALLRVLQEHEFERLGGTQTIRTDARLIAATNRNLQQSIAEGSFRNDLYYRLNVFPIEVPPLRDRREDIPRLVESFVSRYSARIGRRIREVERATMDLFLRYSWPGNIRELQNVVERAVILAEDAVLRVDPQALVAPAPSLVKPFVTEGEPRENALHQSALRQQEREMIETALSNSRGRVAGERGAAARLGLPASTLESKIRALGIDKHRFKSRMDALVKRSVA
jgi:formate hydrogenlyase transcriptional activator